MHQEDAFVERVEEWRGAEEYGCEKIKKKMKQTL